jgi:hypothetical protein
MLLEIIGSGREVGELLVLVGMGRLLCTVKFNTTAF